MKIAVLGWIAAAAILTLSFAVSPNFRWSDAPRPSPYAGDFLHEYAGGSVVREGDRARLYDLDHFLEPQHDAARLGFTWPAELSFPPLYPPFYYVWVSPLSRLDYRSAAHLWSALSVAALFASVALILGGGRGSRPPVGVWVAASLCYAPVLETLVSGQKGIFLLLIFAGTWRLLASRRAGLAGALFAFAAFKPQLVLVVAGVMLVSRQWRFVAGMAATGALLGAQSLWVGWDASLAWIDQTLHPMPQPALVGRSHSWVGFARLLTGEWSGPGVVALSIALVAVTLAALARLLRGGLDFASARFPVQLSGIVLATALVSPYLYTYDLAILVLPLILLARQLPAAPPASAALRLIWLVALLAVFAMGSASAVIAERIPVQFSALATFALLVVLVWATPRYEAAPEEAIA